MSKFSCWKKKDEELNQRFIKKDEIQKFIEIVDKEDEEEKAKERLKRRDF